MNRIVGLETEYGCLTSDPFGPAAVIRRVRNWLFENQRYGLADTHQRDWDEPAGNGGFLFNGGRAYVDMGHLEYCTPECLDLRDLLLYDHAGDALLMHALREMGLTEQSGFIRNNIDHYTGATFGCHENYLIRRTAPLTDTNLLALLAFLTVRVLYTGAGRVGATLGAEARGDGLQPGADPRFQISQRADYINNDLFEWVQFNRAIINTRDEPLGDSRKYRRLHLLHGDTSVLPATLALKVGTTALMLDLLEADRMPVVALADTVQTFRRLSHQPNGPWVVTLTDGRQRAAVDLLEDFRAAAEREFRGRDEETDLLLELWKRILDGLASDPWGLVGDIDWITKRWLLQQFIDREQVGWDDPWLAAQDLEYHHIDPLRSLGLGLARVPPHFLLETREVTAATRRAPPNTRAHARSRLMVSLRRWSGRYFVDWEVVDVEGMPSLELRNPFDAAPPEAEAWRRLLPPDRAQPHPRPAAAGLDPTPRAEG